MHTDLGRHLSLAAVIAGAVVLAACRVATATSDDAPGEALHYTSSNIDFFRDAIAGNLDADPVTHEGWLTLPEGDGPFPVVVWQHGSESPKDEEMVSFKTGLRSGLAAEGIGLLLADSYTARQIGYTAGDQSKLSTASRIVDGLRALEALARHPRVDPARVGIAGSSFGGLVAIGTSHEPYAALVLPDGVRYAAHVPFYPSCQSRFERYEPTGAPLLFLLGEADDYTRHDFCLAQADRLREVGASVDVVTYPDAHHDFISTRPVTFYEGIWHFNECGVSVFRTDGEMVGATGSSSVGRTYAEVIREGAAAAGGCARRGVHVGRNDEAARDSLKRAVAFFATHLKQ